MLVDALAFLYMDGWWFAHSHRAYIDVVKTAHIVWLWDCGVVWAINFAFIRRTYSYIK